MSRDLSWTHQENGILEWVSDVEIIVSSELLQLVISPYNSNPPV